MKRKGFTLIEVIAAVAIMSLLITVAGTNLIKKYNESKIKAIIIQENQLVQSGDMVIRDYCKEPLNSSYKLQCDKYYQSYVDSNDDLIIEDGLYTKYVCIKDLKKLKYYSEELKFSGVDCSGVVIYKVDEKTDLQKESFTVVKCGEDYLTNVPNANNYVSLFDECFNNQSEDGSESQQEYTLVVNFTEAAVGGMKVSQSYSQKHKEGDSISINVPSYQTVYSKFEPFIHGSSLNSSSFTMDAGKTKLTGIMPDKNVVINIVYSVKKYKLIINYKEYNDVLGNINFPSKEYELFYGEIQTITYDEVQNFKVIEPIDMIYQVPDRDSVVDVIYQKIEFDLIYDSKGGTACLSRKVKYKDVIGDLCTSTREGYTFNHWSLADGTIATKNTINMTYDDVVLYAKWNANKYNVIYNCNGGSPTSTYSSSHTYDQTSSLIDNRCSKTGYTFAGWRDNNGVNYVNKESIKNLTSVHNNSVTLYAKWNANKYTVNLNANGGTVGTSSINVTYNSTYSSLPTPTRSNYTFLGWYTSSTGGTKITNSTVVTITSSQTLYARWAKSLSVGDYVAYTPSSASYYWDSNYSGYSGTYSSDGFPSTTLSNTSDNYKITSWRVLSINGSKVELVASKPTKGKVPLYGAQGYNNGVKLLNDASSALYGNSSKGITARNVRLEDITSRLTSAALTEINNFYEKSYKVGSKKTYSGSRYYPSMYASEKGSIINGTENTTGLGPSEQSTFITKTASSATEGRLRASSSIKVTETYWYKYIDFFKTAFKSNGNATSSLYCDLFFPEGATTEYWLSTRFNILGDTLATFQIAYVSTYDGDYDSYIGGQKLLSSSGSYYWDVYELFPILTLDISKISYTVNNNTTSYSIN